MTNIQTVITFTIAAVSTWLLFLLNKNLPLNSHRRKTFEGLVLWALYGVLLSLMPVGVDYIIQYIDTLGSVTLVEVIQNGQLAIISGGIAASASGRVAINDVAEREKLYKLFVLAISLFTLLGSSVIYAAISLIDDISPVFVYYLSFNVFIVSLFCGASAQLLTRGGDSNHSNDPSHSDDNEE